MWLLIFVAKMKEITEKNGRGEGGLLWLACHLDFMIMLIKM